MKAIILFAFLCCFVPFVHSCRVSSLPKCPPRQYFDTLSCSCQQCLRSCPKGFQLDQLYCQCKPICQVLDCPQPLQQWSQDQCKCLCPNFFRQPDCPARQQWNQDQCKCVCPIFEKQPECPFGRQWSQEQCRCICPMYHYQPDCPAGQEDSQACPCKKRCPVQLIKQPPCRPDQQLNPDCECVCKPITCKPGLIQNLKNCLCEKCPIYIKKPDCPRGKEWSQDLCKCVCVRKVKCSGDRYFDENSCSCRCKPRICPLGLYQDEKSCECRKQRPTCDLSSITCPTNYIVDMNTCQCVLKCPYYLVQPKCPARQQWSQDQCKCICLIQICLPPLRFDEQTCLCA